MDVDFAKEAKRKRDQKWYANNRDKILARNRERYRNLSNDDKKLIIEKWRKWRNESKAGKAYEANRRSRYTTEEYRAKRRAAYAAKHANDPMTEHRRACIEASKKRQSEPIEERKAKEAAMEDMMLVEDDPKEIKRERTKKERDRENLIKFIECWAHIRKGFRLSGLLMPDPDKAYYRREAEKYVSMRVQYGTADISERNIISIKMRKIEAKFKALYHDKYLNKNKNEYEEYENY